MPEISRRNLIRGAAVVGGAVAAATVSASAAAEGANAATTAQAAGQASGPRHGDIRDIKHVMILMQENRSFDHYFGSLKGVQGFGEVRGRGWRDAREKAGGQQAEGRRQKEHLRW